MKNPLEHFRPWDADRFHTKYKRGAPDDCWLWEGDSGKRKCKAYGMYYHGVGQKKMCSAHRGAYALAYGPFDYSLHVLHKCDTPLCVNPAHLFIGDNNDNISDMLKKRRHWNQKKSVCKRGHEFDRMKNGKRECSQCARFRGIMGRCVKWLEVFSVG